MTQDNNSIEPKDKCVDCEQMVTKRFVKFHKAASAPESTESKKRRKYCDETGRLWHGKRCPSCAVAWRKSKAEEKVAAEKEALKKLLGE
jgi:hypothetical protein